MRKLLTILTCVIVYGLSAKAQSRYFDTSSLVASNVTYKTTYTKCLDTIPKMYNPPNFTLRYYENEKGDTSFKYNHVEFIWRRVQKEMDYWGKETNRLAAKLEGEHYIKYIGACMYARKKFDYWMGVYDALTMIIHQPYEESKFFNYKFEAK